jgi:hypothetical protein
VIGSLVWDTIYREPSAPPVEEWGGIAYALAGFDATLAAEWELVPLIKVGRDLAPRAHEHLRTLRRPARDARFVEVDAPNNRVVLHYQSAERRTEHMSGGVPPWTWAELGPMVRDLDALYVNFISGFEMSLETAEALRRGFPGPIYTDLHSLFLGILPDGERVARPLPDAPSWFGCSDVVQLNEDEMRQLSPDPLSLSADALGAGVSLLVVTLAARGVAYVTAGAPGAAISAGAAAGGAAVRAAAGATLRTARIPADAVDVLDPTGCGDVFGAAAFSRLLAGDEIEAALRHATHMAARNAGYRGAGGLSLHLRGELVRP